MTAVEPADPPNTPAWEALALSTAQNVRLGVVSDTHGHTGFALEAVRMLAELEVDVVIHCGDIGSPEIPRLFAPWPTHYVFGNVDSAGRLRSYVTGANRFNHERFGELTLAGRRVAWLHGDDFDLLDRTIGSGQYALVCHGHTHVQRCEPVGPTLVLNPGALYRATPHSIAIVDLPAVRPTFITL